MQHTKWMGMVVGMGLAQACADAPEAEIDGAYDPAAPLATTQGALTGTGPELAPVLQGPNSAIPGATIKYNAMVLNQGNASASAFTVTITATGASALTVPGGSCTASGNTRTCTVTSTGLLRGYAYRKAFSVKAKSTPSTLGLTVRVSTPNDLLPSNDSYPLSVQVAAMPSALTVAPPVNTDNLVCSGSQPLSFSDCEAAPSSYVPSRFTLHPDNTFTLVGQPDVLGSWAQPTSTSLELSVPNGTGGVSVLFQGSMSAPSCFRGSISYLLATTPRYGAFQLCLMP